MNNDLATELLRDMSARVPGNLISFARAMDDAGFGPSVDGWPYFLERSEKWASEYTTWVNAGNPTSEDDNFSSWVSEVEVASR